MSSTVVDDARAVPAVPADEPDPSRPGARRRGALKILLVMGFYGLVTVFFFRPVVFDDQHFSTVASLEQYYFPWQVDHQYGQEFLPQTDEGETFYPRSVFVDRVVHDGELPTWDPYTFAGHPYLSNGATTFFYPVRQAVTWLADPALAHDLYLMLHMFGAGLAVYFLCRELRISTLPSLFAGLAWMWSPYFLAWIQLELSLPIIVWLPVALALVHRAHRTRSWAWLGAAALPLGLMLDGGTLDQATGAVAVVGLYGGFLELADLYRTRQAPGLRRRTLNAFGRLCALGALGLGLGMVTYLPFALLSQRIARSPIPYDVYTRELNVPFDQFGRLWDHLPLPVDMYDMHRMTFVGTIVAALAIIGLFQRRPGAGLGRALLVGSIAAFAYTPLTSVIDKLSSQYRYISPGRFLWAWVLGMVVLAALGLDQVLRWIVGRRGGPSTSWVQLVVAAGLVAVVSITYELELFWIAVPAAVAVAALLVITSGRVDIDAEPVPQTELVWSKPTMRQTGAVVLVALALVMTALQLYHYGRDINVAFTPRTSEYLFPTTPVIDALEARNATPAGDRNLPVYVEGHGTPIDSSLPGIYPFESAAGYDSALPSWVADLWRVVGGKDAAFVSANPLSQGLRSLFSSTATRFDLLPRLGITSILTEPGIDATPGWDSAGVAQKGLTPSYEGADGRLYDVQGAAPRAYVVHASESEASQAAGLARFTDPSFPWRTTVLVAGSAREGDPSGGAAAPLEPATVERHDLDAVRVKVHSDGPGWLVLLDSYDEGWTATVDGRSVPVRRANTSFRAVPVPGGDSTVEFRYTTPGLKVGAALSGLSLVIVAVLMAEPAVRRRRRAERPQPSVGGSL